MSSVYFPPRTQERTFLPLGLLQPQLFKQCTSIAAKFWDQVFVCFLLGE